MAERQADGKLTNQGEKRTPEAATAPSAGQIFEIRVKGQLDSRWSDWLEGLEVKLLENGDMLLFGPIADQAALMGILNKLNRLNLEVRSLNEVNKSKQETK